MSPKSDQDEDEKYDGSRGREFRKYKRNFLARSRGRFAKDDKYRHKQIIVNKRNVEASRQPIC